MKDSVRIPPIVTRFVLLVAAAAVVVLFVHQFRPSSSLRLIGIFVCAVIVLRFTIFTAFDNWLSLFRSGSAPSESAPTSPLVNAKGRFVIVVLTSTGLLALLTLNDPNQGLHPASTVGTSQHGDSKYASLSFWSKVEAIDKNNVIVVSEAQKLAAVASSADSSNLSSSFISEFNRQRIRDADIKNLISATLRDKELEQLPSDQRQAVREKLTVAGENIGRVEQLRQVIAMPWLKAQRDILRDELTRDGQK